ncbi:hypothetical protein GS399_05385 [Pedobacter sp. HMF7647]|uniref:Uncharacterized protein n=1 Tax=Hufsiella arboris TaxID=2695275 RepID=A0A7K1Y8M7_9SPHI|nr:hypothetical protein [Hufsiella arboris]MXV50398.1 hypothetical protein [Hufsiella arboris]
MMKVSEWSFVVKNRLLWAAAACLLLLSYRLAISPTLDELSRYNRLATEAEQGASLAFSPQFLERKDHLLDSVLKVYRVDSTEWRNDFWLKVSRIGSRNNCDVVYEPQTENYLTDSLSVVAKQEIVMNGEFRQLIVSLDSLEHLKGCGKIYSLALKRRDEPGMKDQKDRQVGMLLRFAAYFK